MRTAAAALLLLLCAPSARCEEVAFKIGLSTAKPKLAERFTVRVELTCPAPYEVRPATTTLNDPVFELAGVKRLKPSAAGALKTEVFELEAAAFGLGVSTFPATEWLLLGGAEPKKASSPRFTVEILPAFDKEKEKDNPIRDIYPPFRFIPWLWIILGLLAAVGAGWFLYRKFGARAAAAGGQGASGPDLRTPYRKAMDALEALLRSGLWDGGQVKEFYSALSDIFRTYLSAEFGVAAELMTTAMITRDLKRTGADIRAIIRTREFLEAADLVKFAKHRPADRDRDAAVSALKELLSAFAAQKEAAAAAAAARELELKGAPKP